MIFTVPLREVKRRAEDKWKSGVAVPRRKPDAAATAGSETDPHFRRSTYPCS
jgi:hypothetical protein